MTSVSKQLTGQYPHALEKTVTSIVNCKYLLFLPKCYEEQKSWPLILFLHGKGECGDDLEKIKVHGMPKVVGQNEDFPFIALSPQCPEGQWWSSQVLIALLDEIASLYNVDTDRIYLTGLSMGGFGTWNMACHYPEHFAAIAPICGGGETFAADRLKDMPIWAFHGEKDEVIPVKRTIEMADAVKSHGGNVKVTIYPDAEHDSWTDTYENNELYDWFLKHKKK